MQRGNNKMTTIFASDFHGTGDAFITKVQFMIEKYPSAHVVFGGDYIDGRLNSKQVINYVWQMQKLHNAIALKGSHEISLDDFLNHIAFNDWYQNGGNTTFKSLFNCNVSCSIACKMLNKYRLFDSNFLEYWIDSLKTVHVNEDGIFAHAYIDVGRHSTAARAVAGTGLLRRMTDSKAIVKLTHNHTEKALVVGHTPTYLFAENQRYFTPVHITPYSSKIIKCQTNKCPIIEYHYDNEQSIIACDGGCASGDNFNTGNVAVIEKGKIIDWIN